MKLLVPKLSVSSEPETTLDPEIVAKWKLELSALKPNEAGTSARIEYLMKQLQPTRLAFAAAAGTSITRTVTEFPKLVDAPKFVSCCKLILSDYPF